MNGEEKSQNGVDGRRLEVSELADMRKLYARWMPCLITMEQKQ